MPVENGGPSSHDCAGHYFEKVYSGEKAVLNSILLTHVEGKNTINSGFT